MGGPGYSRLKFWILSIIVILIGSFVMGFAKYVSVTAYMAASTACVGMLVYILGNRIRNYGGNHWLALFAFVPFVGMFQALYYGCVKYKNSPQQGAAPVQSQNSNQLQQSSSDNSNQAGQDSDVDSSVDK